MIVAFFYWNGISSEKAQNKKPGAQTSKGSPVGFEPRATQ
jgi:hypothetical protein